MNLIELLQDFNKEMKEIFKKKYSEVYNYYLIDNNTNIKDALPRIAMKTTIFELGIKLELKKTTHYKIYGY